MQKTANQLYRESGTSLSFKEWLEEKKLNADGTSSASMIIDKSLNDSVQEAIQSGKNAQGYKNTLSGKTVLGIPQTYVYIAGGLLAVYIGYELYKVYKVK